MAYETGSAASSVDLLDKFRLFCVANGATQAQWYLVAAGVNNDRILHLQIGGKDFLLSAQPGGTASPHTKVALKLFTGVGTGLAWASYTLAGTQVATGSMGSGPFTAYHFFQSGGTFSCVVEFTAGAFTHFSIGNVNKKGTYTGGEFVTATCWGVSEVYLAGSTYHSVSFDGGSASNNPNGGGYSGHVRADFSSDSSPRYRYFGHPTAGASRCTGGVRDALNGFLVERSPNLVNLRAVLMPIPLFAMDAAQTSWVYLGDADGVAYCKNTYILPGAVVDTDWRVFPIMTRHLTQQSGSVVSSRDYAIAYKMN